MFRSDLQRYSGRHTSGGIAKDAGHKTWLEKTDKIASEFHSAVTDAPPDANRENVSGARPAKTLTPGGRMRARCAVTRAVTLAETGETPGLLHQTILSIIDLAIDARHLVFRSRLSSGSGFFCPCQELRGQKQVLHPASTAS